MKEPQETWVQSLGRGDPLAKEVTTHSSILACRIPWSEETGGLHSIASQESWTWLSTHAHPKVLFPLCYLNSHHLPLKRVARSTELEARGSPISKSSWVTLAGQSLHLSELYSAHQLSTDLTIGQRTRNHSEWDTQLIECTVDQQVLLFSCSDVSKFLQVHRLWPIRLRRPCDLHGKNPRVGSHFFREFSWPKDGTRICTAGRFFSTEPPGKPQ